MAREDVKVGATVQWRDPFGRFAAQINEAAADVAREAAKEGAHIARGLAPGGRRGRIAKAIKVGRSTGARAGWAVVGDAKLRTIAASHESGAVEHRIESHDGGPLINRKAPGVGGKGYFYARSGKVVHPGNVAVRYMERARKAVARNLIIRARRRIPGAKG